MSRIYEDWSLNRVFKIEKDRYKHKKYLFTPMTKTKCQGYNNKNIYPLLVSDALSKYYRMQGQNVMFPVGYNSLNEDSLNYARLKGDSLDNLNAYYHTELCDMAVGFDYEKEIELSDKNFIIFTQIFFEKLYNDGYITEVNKECFVDFSNHIIVPKYRVKMVNNECYDITNNDKLHVKKCRALALNLKKIDGFFENIKELNIGEELKEKIYKILECRKGLNMNFYSYEHEMGIEVSLDNPELIAGISFIALNPSLIDVAPYVTEDERETINDYISSGYSDYDCYTGLSLNNPLTGNAIYVFVSYKFDEAIHIGIPSDNILDGMFASSLGIEAVEVISDGIIKNSDFLDGLTKELANEQIVNTFVSEGMATDYLIPSIDELIITSYDELGVLVPIVKNYKDEIFLLDNTHYPIYYNNRYKIVITNENSIDSDLNPLRMVFNEDFIRGLSNIYARVYDKDIGNSDFFTNDSIYDEFNDMLGIFDSKTAYIDVFYNVLFNSLLKKYNKNYKSYSDIILLDNLELDNRFIEEHQRLGISFVEEIINRTSSDVYRLYLFTENHYHDDLGDTIVSLKKYENFIENIKYTYSQDFEIGVFENKNFIEFKKTATMLIESYNFKEYSSCLITFYNEYMKEGIITKTEAIEYLIMLSIICPSICEEIFRNKFNEKYSIFFSEWPL
ncbi:MAG: class I tRNA ligase family protein [Anaeroplasmataceae bacterium]